jgi:hypothetical protein
MRIVRAGFERGKRGAVHHGWTITFRRSIHMYCQPSLQVPF